MGSLFNRLPSQQIGIGYYETVGTQPPRVQARPVGDAPPQVVVAPEVGDAQIISQREAVGALLALSIFACGAVAAWAGSKFVQQMKGQAA